MPVRKKPSLSKLTIFALDPVKLLYIYSHEFEIVRCRAGISGRIDQYIYTYSISRHNGGEVGSGNDFIV